MRSIGTIAEKERAETFLAVLIAADIWSELESEPDGAWRIWVESDDKLDEAKAMLARFMENPEHPEFTEASRLAEDKLKALKEAEKKAERNTYDLRGKWQPVTGIGPLTFLLMAACVLATMYGGFGSENEVLQKYYTTLYSKPVRDQMPGVPGVFLTEVKHGEYWRLITPIFFHLGYLHLLFNMGWLHQFGTLVEKKKSSFLLILIVLLTGVISNVAQYYFSGPGMGFSGVGYGLFGFLWMRAKFDPKSKLSMDKKLVRFFIVWFFFCFTGIIGPIGNVAHGAGMLSGMAFGFVTAKLFRENKYL
ncbi:MAG: rhomboid family intramembrane serine protease [Planctomycetes bacterium]|nr:rhomboid family intramembrane serine protease [Planctomycetota bacterium]